jgi:hypothetical protein
MKLNNKPNENPAEYSEKTKAPLRWSNVCSGDRPAVTKLGQEGITLSPYPETWNTGIPNPFPSQVNAQYSLKNKKLLCVF